ncbi:hypothetical protein BU16DRAFT_565460 [Lophium mytilinum]|uniref:Uncharacterized protein n=1 Tax=Lophium mytilinum TaxID=390894 RepID=A0A6A6QI90_9PEZI|nr:hypothetical protein BU16DRAFT_565460 [Lophium mytilinum]
MAGEVSLATLVNATVVGDSGGFRSQRCRPKRVDDGGSEEASQPELRGQTNTIVRFGAPLNVAVVESKSRTTSPAPGGDGFQRGGQTCVAVGAGDVSLGLSPTGRRDKKIKHSPNGWQ